MGAEARALEHGRRGELTALLDAIDALPTMPVVADKVGRLVHDPSSDARQIAHVMRGDPALTAKVLKLVNSPYFGIPGGVTDVTRAISFLGFNTLYQLVLTASVFRVFGGRTGASAQRLFRHSLAVAGAAEALAEIVRHPRPAVCFTAGILHDIGKLALLEVAPDQFAESVSMAETAGLATRDAEVAIGLMPHDRIGARLAKRWRFPLELQVAIGHHHEPATDDRGALPSNVHPIVDVTLLADALVHRLGYGSIEVAEPVELPPLVLERLGLDEAVEVRAHDLLQMKMERSELLMEVLAG